MTGTSTVSADSLGDVDVAAGEDFDDGSEPDHDQAGDADGEIDMADGTVIQTQDGNITMSATSNVILSKVDADSDLDNIRGDVTMTAAGGAITDANLAALNIRGAQATLTAFSGIGTAGDRIEYDVTPP